MQAIILAGGFGTRLKATLPNLPKPLAPIKNKPFLAWLMDDLISQGITDITLSLHHKPDAIKHAFGSEYCHVPVHYVVEESPLGTGGAIAYAMQQRGITQPVHVINGDTFVKIDRAAMFKQHCAAKNDATVALIELDDCSRYGQITVDNNARITAFNAAGKAGRGLINAGSYVLSPSVLDRMALPGPFSIEYDFYAKQCDRLQFGATISKDYFIDIGVPEDYARAQTELPAIAA